MARVSEKALRPREYVFNRLSAERIAQLSPGVQKLMKVERVAATRARAAEAAREASEAARHAQNIISGVQTPDPESEAIRALEKELEELQDKKRRLYAQLKKKLETDGEPKVEMEVAAPLKSTAKQENVLEKRSRADAGPTYASGIRMTK